MKSKLGFTLAEVLITLGIIGVVAALTAPALVKNSGRAKVGPALAKFVNTFETGMSQMMTDGNISTLKENVGGNIVLLSKYIVMTPLSKKNSERGDTYVVYNATGKQTLKIKPSTIDNVIDCMNGYSSSCTDHNGNGVIDVGDIVVVIDKYNKSRTLWQLKDGSIMYIQPLLEDEYGKEKGSFEGIVAEILYDIDGNKAVNKAGKDVFAFLLDASGTLIPAGSNMHKYLQQDGTTFVKTHSATCALDSSFDNNFACTGKIADNNWKAVD